MDIPMRNADVLGAFQKAYPSGSDAAIGQRPRRRYRPRHHRRRPAAWVR